MKNFELKKTGLLITSKKEYSHLLIMFVCDQRHEVIGYARIIKINNKIVNCSPERKK